MHRLALLLLVGLLASTTGGILDLLLPEPCGAAESGTVPSDDTCPPTCVKCHCARAFDFVVQLHVATLPVIAPAWLPPAAPQSQLYSRDILHVPKPALG